VPKRLHHRYMRKRRIAAVLGDQHQPFDRGFSTSQDEISAGSTLQKLRF
jgi:hypothetical protein